MNNIRKKTSLILTFIATVFLSLAIAFSNGGMNNVKASSSDNPEGFTLERGADIAVSSDYSGIRWETKVSKAYFNGLKEAYPDANFTFGTFVVPASTVSGIEEIDENFAGAINIEANSEGVVEMLEGFTSDTEVVSYYSVIDYDSIVEAYTALHEVDPDNYPLDNVDDIKANAYKVLVMARSYVKIEAGGVVEYNYSGVEMSQSARLVATMSIISGKTNSSSENYNAVLDFIGGVDPVKNDAVISYNILHSEQAQSFAFPELAGKTIDEIAFNATKIDYVIDGENLVINSDISSAVTDEKNYIIAYTSEGVIYREVKLLNIIETPDDFVQAFALANGSLTTATSVSELALFDKEYYLGNNIDFTGYAMPTETYTYTGYNYFTNSKIVEAGLTGTFDGQGYAIYNLVAPQGGLFGIISGTLKNVAFINCSINSAEKTHSGFLAQMISSSAKLENVYIKLTDEVSTYKHVAATYLNNDLTFDACYFEADLSLLLSPITNENAYHKGTLTSSNNKAIFITRQMLGSRNAYGTLNGIEGNLNGTTENRPYYGTTVAPDSEYDEVNNQNPRKNPIRGAFYRYESVEDMLKYYNGTYTQTDYLKTLLDEFNAQANYSVIDGKVVWNNDYTLYNGDAQVNNQIVLRNESGLNEASFSVKDGLGNVVDGFTFELANDNGVVILEGSKITLASLGDDVLLVKNNGVVYFTVKVSATKPVVENTESTVVIDVDGEIISSIEDEIINVVVRAEGVTATVTDNNVALVGATIGETYVIEVETKDSVTVLNARYVSANIKTAEEFVSIFALAKGDLTSATTLEDLATFDGYYVLANNIDFAGMEMPTDTYTFSFENHYNTTAAYEVAKTKGLTGTFDGNGYAIYNLKAPKGGLFGIINGTIKNVAFIDIDLAEATTGGLFGALLTEKARLTNVYIDYSVGYKDSTYAITNYAIWSADYAFNKVYISAEIALFKNAVYSPAGKTGETQYTSATFTASDFIYISKQAATIGDSNYRINDVKGTFTTDNKPLRNNATAPLQNGGSYRMVGSDYALRFNSVNAEGDAYSLVSSYATYKTIIDGYNNDYFEVGLTGKIAWRNDTASYAVYQDTTLVEDNTVQLQTSGTASETILSVKTLAEVIVNGYTYELSNNDGVVALDGAKLTALKEGTATVLVKKDNVTCFTLTVEVTKPVVQKDLIIEVEQDSAEGSENGVLTAEELASIFDTDSNTVVAVKSLDDELVLELDGANRIIFKNVDDSPFVATGKSYKVIIYNDTYGVELNVMPITKIIRTASDLGIFITIPVEYQAHGKEETDSDITKMYSFDGYYVLGNDINADGINTATCGDTAAANASLHSRLVYSNGASLLEDSDLGKTAMSKGLTGVFDGRGYTISNLVTVRGGLFGFVSGTIKNVAFTNIKQQYIYGETSASFTYMLAIRVFSTAEIDNVYFEHIGSAGKTSLFGSISRTAKITNLYYKSNKGAMFAVAARNNSTDSQYGTSNIYKSGGAYNNFSNVIIVSNANLGGLTNKNAIHVVKDSNSKFSITGTTWKLTNETIKHFISADDMTTMYQATYPYTNADVWNTEVTTSAKSVIDAFENDYFNVVVTKDGDTITNVAINWADKNA